MSGAFIAAAPSFQTCAPVPHEGLLLGEVVRPGSDRPPVDALWSDDFLGTDLDWDQWQWFDDWDESSAGQNGPPVWSSNQSYTVANSVLTLVSGPSAHDVLFGFVSQYVVDPRGRTLTMRLNLQVVNQRPSVLGDADDNTVPTSWGQDRYAGWIRPQSAWDAFVYGACDMDNGRICPIADYSWNYDYPVDVIADARWHIVTYTMAPDAVDMRTNDGSGNLTQTWHSHPVTITIDGNPLVPGLHTPWAWANRTPFDADIDSADQYFEDSRLGVGPWLYRLGDQWPDVTYQLQLDWIAVTGPVPDP